MSLGVGDGEMQHLDYCFNVGLFEKFGDTKGLLQTIRGRKRAPSFQFSVGRVGPIHVREGVQVEVDSGCEGRNDIVLIEAKCGQPADFIVRQLFYPYQMWRQEVPQKRIRPWFFCSHEIAGRRLYKFWEYAFLDETQYESLTLRKGEAFLVEPRRTRLSVEELLQTHIGKQADKRSWDVPQADSFWRVAEIPLLIEQGINTSAKVAQHYEFDQRQSSYYRQAAEFLGLASIDKKTNLYCLTDLGQEYATRSADERRQLLAGMLAEFPPMRATLELSAKAGDKGIGREEIANLIARNSTIAKSTPGRRAATLLSWLKWLQEATGAVHEKQKRFVLD